LCSESRLLWARALMALMAIVQTHPNGYNFCVIVLRRGWAVYEIMYNDTEECALSTHTHTQTFAAALCAPPD
jgi:hypothetical protein